MLIVESAPGFGGSLTGVLHLIDAFPSSINLTLLAAFDPREYTDVPARLRVEVAPIDLTRTGRQPSDSFVGGILRYVRHNTLPWARHVARVAKQTGADLIHANNMALGNFGSAVAGWRLNIPVICHQKGFEHDGRLIRAIIRRRWYSHYIATSHAIASHLVSLGVPERNCTMVYDAVIPPDGLSAKTERDVLVIAMHSVLRESKGQDVFLRAVAMLDRDSLPPFRVVIAGSPPLPSPYPERLRALARELGIEDHVEFVGHVRNPFELLSRVDVSVHASIDPEPFGRVAAESMIVGVPVIAAAGSGAAEYVEDADAGFTTPPGDVRALSAAIARLLVSKPLRQDMGERGRRFAQKEFSPDAIVRQLVDIYQDVASGAPPRSNLLTAVR